MKEHAVERAMSRPDGDVTVQQMVDFIDKGYAERITLKTVAATVRGNPAKLGRRFLATVGVSVHGYVTRVRLEHAADLIVSNTKVEAVALGVGYRSKKNFYRQFSRHFGLTPEAFRKRQRLGHR
jgi:transcriptional regulator GlxA family with amidase domain